MKLVYAILLFVDLSVQLPRPATKGQLQPRTHVYSAYSSSLKRQLWGQPSIVPRQSASSIIDNNRVRYLAPITIGSQTFDAELDSGSSDLWIVQQGFQCYERFDKSQNSFETLQSPETCNFGPALSIDSSYQTDVYEFTCYGDGVRCVEGPLGSAPVSFCGLTVQQTVGAPSVTSYHTAGQPGVQSGIIGLAFSSLTHAYTTTGQQTTYSSIMNTIFASYPSLPRYWSLALSRDNSANANGGIIAIGGTPAFDDPKVNVSSPTYSSAPLQIDPNVPGTISFYSIFVDGFVLGSNSGDSGTQVIIDSGSPRLDIPADLADAVNALWYPAIASDGRTLDCNAVLTQSFAVVIGGVPYYISYVDLIASNGDGSCSSLVVGASSGYSLGDPFLRNVLAIYDWGASQMAFYPRMEYES